MQSQSCNFLKRKNGLKKLPGVVLNNHGIHMIIFMEYSIRLSEIFKRMTKNWLPNGIENQTAFCFFFLFKKGPFVIHAIYCYLLFQFSILNIAECVKANMCVFFWTFEAFSWETDREKCRWWFLRQAMIVVFVQILKKMKMRHLKTESTNYSLFNILCDCSGRIVKNSSRFKTSSSVIADEFLFMRIFSMKCKDWLIFGSDFVLTKKYKRSHGSSTAPFLTRSIDRSIWIEQRNNASSQSVCGSYRHVGDFCKHFLLSSEKIVCFFLFKIPFLKFDVILFLK